MDCLKMKNTVSEMTNILGRIINRVDTRKMSRVYFNNFKQNGFLLF